jgi:hypothetical protein
VLQLALQCPRVTAVPRARVAAPQQRAIVVISLCLLTGPASVSMHTTAQEQQRRMSKRTNGS